MLMPGTGAVSLGSGYSSGPRPFRLAHESPISGERRPAQHLPDGCAHPEGHCRGFVVSEQLTPMFVQW